MPGCVTNMRSAIPLKKAVFPSPGWKEMPIAPGLRMRFHGYLLLRYWGLSMLACTGPVHASTVPLSSYMHLPCCVWKTHFIDSTAFDFCDLSNPPSAQTLSLQGRNCCVHSISATRLFSVHNGQLYISVVMYTCTSKDFILSKVLQANYILWAIHENTERY